MLLSNYYGYVIGGLILISVGLSAGWYVADLKLDKAKAEVGAVEARLSVSNSSVATLEAELLRIKKTLSENERIERERQEANAEKLRAQDKKDKSLVDLEASLKSRKTTLNCTIPKDLKEAWDAL